MGVRVLIVDDHADFRRMARALLTSSGYEVVGEADDAATALSAFDELQPDLVVLDVQLPTDDGIEISHQLNERNNRPQVVLVSSREASDYGHRLLDAPVRGFIRKRDFSGASLRPLICQG